MSIKHYSLFVFLISQSIVAFAQISDKDVIPWKKIIVVNDFDNTYSWGSAKKLQAAFGPTQRIKYNAEMIDHQGYMYKYKGLEVDFNGMDCDAIIVKGNNYKVLLSGHAYTVGDNISKLKSQFPKAYKNRIAIEKGIGAGLGTLWIYIFQSDAYVSIKYDQKGIIYEIWMGNDNS